MQPTKKRLMVVDDLEAHRMSLARVLRTRHSVATAPHAHGALRLLGWERFDAIVSDHEMPPGPDGLWLLNEVARIAPKTRRFLMSANEPPGLSAFLHLGVVEAFFPKPIHVADLIAQLD